MECVVPTPNDATRFLRYTGFNPSNLSMRNMTVFAEGAPDLVRWKRIPIPELVIRTEAEIAWAGVESWWHST
jgi:hypothetical protein